MIGNGSTLMARRSAFDKAGGYDPPAPLMDWPEIQALAAEGVRFGSHMANHTHMEELASRQTALEASRSKALLERALGEPCLSIAAPFSVDRRALRRSKRSLRPHRPRLRLRGFTVDPGVASLANDALRLPRIEVQGGWSIGAFADAVRPAPG